MEICQKGTHVDLGLLEAEDKSWAKPVKQVGLTCQSLGGDREDTGFLLGSPSSQMPGQVCSAGAGDR